MSATHSQAVGLGELHKPVASLNRAGAGGAESAGPVPPGVEHDRFSGRPHERKAGRRCVPVHRDRNVLCVLLGIVGFFSVWGCTAALGGWRTVGALLDLPAALLVCLTPATILTAVYGWAGVVEAIGWLFRKPAPAWESEPPGEPARRPESRHSCRASVRDVNVAAPEPAERQACSKAGMAPTEAATFFQLAAALALAGGFLTSMVGLVLLFAQTKDLSRVGPGLAVALLSQLYGVFLAVVFIAAAAYVARKHNGPPQSSPVAYRAAGIAGITTIAGTLTAMIAFGILMLSLAPNY